MGRGRALDQGWQVAAYWQAVFERGWPVPRYGSGETNQRSNAGRSGRLFKRRLLREFLRRVDRFCTSARPNRQFYLEQGIGEARLAPAPYCVDNARFAMQPLPLAANVTEFVRNGASQQTHSVFSLRGKFVANNDRWI